jgi:hypothetical protein
VEPSLDPDATYDPDNFSFPHDGLAQGIAQALYEEAVYDSSGNLVTRGHGRGDAMHAGASMARDQPGEFRDGRRCPVIAGGQSLLPLLRLRLAYPNKLVDVGAIAGLRGVLDAGETLQIGALAAAAGVS